jgi:hypothetical protein
LNPLHPDATGSNLCDTLKKSISHIYLWNIHQHNPSAGFSDIMESN